MDKAIPWEDLLRIVERRYRKVGDNGRPKMPAERMLRIYFLQQWFNLSDPGAEEALYDRVSMRMFAGIELGTDAIPDETTILNFRRFLMRSGLFKNTCQLFSLCPLTIIFRLRHRLATS